MKRHYPFGLTVLLALAAIAGLGIAPLSTAADKSAKVAATPAQETTYAELEHRIGDTILVETTLGTRHEGVLKAWTSYSFDMQLGPKSGSIELTVPAEDVRSVRVMTAVEPAIETEVGSAKKN